MAASNAGIHTGTFDDQLASVGKSHQLDACFISVISSAATEAEKVPACVCEVAAAVYRARFYSLVLVEQTGPHESLVVLDDLVIAEITALAYRSRHLVGIIDDRSIPSFAEEFREAHFRDHLPGERGGRR